MKKILLMIALITLTSLFACKGEEEAKPLQDVPQPIGAQKKVGFTMDSPPIEVPADKPAMIIEVPEEIEAAWSAVELEVINKENIHKNEIYTLKLHEEKAIKVIGVKVKVLHFIPNFTMGDGVMTSVDTNPENPAVHLSVTEGDKEIWNGIAFHKYPDTHSFEHKNHFIIMKNYIPSGGK